MKNIKYIIIWLALPVVLLTSCVSPRRVNYLQDITHGSQIQIENRFEAQIAPYDELSISVTTSSSNKELAAPFAPFGANSSQGYLVDVNGDIDMPILGRLHVAGMTRLQLQDSLSRWLLDGGYIDDPFVMVRFKTFKIFYLGSGKGQVLTVQNERCTFLEALAMLGDIGIHVRRDRLSVMREVNGRMVVRRLDPRSSKVFNDPFFMLQQNDFIIADTYDNSLVRQEVSYWLAISTTIASVSSLILSLFILKNTK